MTAIKAEDYERFCRFLERSSGIVLGEHKQYLVSSRLGHTMSRHGFTDLGALVEALDRAGAQSLRGEVIEAMTTNETQWFRDGYPFLILQNYLFPEWLQARRWRTRIWSAACSSGQEAYSVAMTNQEFNDQGNSLDTEIIGTDIAPAMISHANAARYGTAAMNRGLSRERQERFFTPVDEAHWEVKPEIRRRAHFRLHNLLESYSLLGRFDLIMCRNVLIYFSAESRQDIISRMSRILNPGGYLMLGASESLARHSDAFEMVRTANGSIYRLKA
ncbi:CheR family methyltransferase [Alkalilimnicola sp. S0819]|uniref:CheR family methyltransferase n=1 Tax=Alkalilimnicola sp. S0819 TaxID=2613922 RepID=UPI001261B8A1|nr:protein-glutamate O-methyltransferase CheR [Alkalilimnicola sp. S0819]KAB7627202.1 protein-glutamate O-methyltransferase CheR [Alkalilimnicola sp. S0819]MPQ15915.1 methyltransferase domain-containing protein [Alkalilimnicola sp. S0819]